MKRIRILMIFTFVLLGFMLGNSAKVSATIFSDYLPGGKNYLEGLNFVQQGSTLASIDPIRIKSSNDYTVTIPGYDYIGEGFSLYINGDEDYIDIDMYNQSDCDVDNEEIVCTFQTSSSETHLSIVITGDGLSYYYGFYGFAYFQLEEGIVATPYEEYVTPYIDSTKPVFDGYGAFITSYENTTTIEEIIGSHIMAIDEIDGDISNLIEIVSDEYTSNIGVIGEYDVLLSVEDSSMNEATFHLIIMIKDEIAPLLLIDDTIYVNVSDELTLEAVLNNELIYYDGYDEVIDYVIITDNYTINSSEIGEYLVELSITDSSGNVTTKTSMIRVFDNQAPVMISNSSIVQNVDDLLLIQEIVDGLVFIDDYDETITTEIQYDEYTEVMSLGTYFVELTVTDSSNNSRDITLSIEIVDLTIPSLDGPSSISFSYTDLKSIQEIVEMYIATDNYDVLQLTDIYVVSDDYSYKVSETGSYEVVIGVTDNSNNEYQKTIIVEVYDDVVPIIFLDEYIVQVEVGVSFTRENALYLLKNNLTLEDKEYQVAVLVDEYTGNEDVVGEYIYQVQFTDDLGTTLEKDFMIKVVDNSSSNHSNLMRTIFAGGFIVVFSVFVFIKKRK